MSIKLDDSDLRRLTKKIKKMGTVPQKCVDKAAKKGSNVILDAARKNAPAKTGALKRGITSKPENNRKKAKQVYQITLSASMNDIFQKPIKHPGLYGGDPKNKHGYYPASMEHGFLTANGREEGAHYMLKAAEEHGAQACGLIISTLEKELDKEWAKK